MKTKEADKDEQDKPPAERTPRANTIPIPGAQAEKAKDPNKNVDQPEPDVSTHDYAPLSMKP